MKTAESILLYMMLGTYIALMGYFMYFIISAIVDGIRKHRKK